MELRGSFDENIFFFAIFLVQISIHEGNDYERNPAEFSSLSQLR